MRWMLSLLVCLAASVLEDPPEPKTLEPAPRADGVVVLPAEAAELAEGDLEFTHCRQLIAGWRATAKERAIWQFRLERKGTFQLLVEYAATGSVGETRPEVDVEVAGQTRPGPIHSTGSAETFLPQPLVETVTLEAGKQTLTLRLRDLPEGMRLHVKQVLLVPAEESDQNPEREEPAGGL